MTNKSKVVFASVAGALFAVLTFNTYAEDQVKSGGAADRPARALDADGVKAQGASGKPGRGLEEDSPVKARNPRKYSRQADNTAGEKSSVKAPNQKKQSRSVEGERLALPRTGKPGNELVEAPAKPQGSSDKSSPATDKASK